MKKKAAEKVKLYLTRVRNFTNDLIPEHWNSQMAAMRNQMCYVRKASDGTWRVEGIPWVWDENDFIFEPNGFFSNPNFLFQKYKKGKL